VWEHPDALPADGRYSQSFAIVDVLTHLAQITLKLA
jgi:hypothetical protein